MADYRDDPRWKEYGFGRDMFPGGGTTPVASSEYMTADAGDALRRAWGWIKEKGRSETTGPEAMGLGIPDYTPEKGELYKYLDSSREDAERKALEERDRLLRETEEYDKTFKKISGEYDEYGKTERSGDITKEAEVRRAWEDWADYGSPTDGDSDTIVVDPTTGVDILYDSATPILDIIGSGTSGSKMSLETPLEAIPEVDTFKELSSTPKTSRVLYSPFAGDVPPPEPFKTEGFTEYFDRIRPGRRDKIAESGTKYIFGKEEVGSYPGAGWNVYESPGFGGEEGRSIPYETYDSYGRPFVMGMDGRWQHKELAPLLWDSAERQHNASMKAQTDKRNAQIAAYWEKVDEHTKFVEDYIKSSGITAEEYSKRSTAATPLKSEYVKEHPDYEELVREAVPTLDERLDVPDIRTYTPAAGEEVDSSLLDSILPTASAAGAPSAESPPISMADRLKSIESGTDPTIAGMKEGGWGVDGLAALGAIPGGAILGGTLGAVGGMLARGTGIHKALTGSRIPGTAGTVDEYARAKAATAAGDDARLAAGEFAFPVGERGPISILADVPILGPASKRVKEVLTRDVDVLSSTGMLTDAGKISSTAERELLSKVAREVYGESTLATRAAVKKRLADELPDHDLGGWLPKIAGTVASKATDYLSAMTKAAIAGKAPTEYARTVPKSTLDDFVGPGKLKAGEEMVGSGVDAAFRRGMADVAEDMYGKMSTSALKGGGIGAIGMGRVGAALDAKAAGTPYTDPYLSMIDPTFAPDASIHYTDPLKHYDTETVSGHLPLSLTTPFTTAVEGWEHAAEFAPPEWSDPAMPPPSDYSYSGFIPSSPFGTAPYSPPGYSPITGTFYPTAAEIIAAGGGELFTEPSPLMIP